MTEHQAEAAYGMDVLCCSWSQRVTVYHNRADTAGQIRQGSTAWGRGVRHRLFHMAHTGNRKLGRISNN